MYAKSYPKSQSGSKVMGPYKEKCQAILSINKKCQRCDFSGKHRKPALTTNMSPHKIDFSLL